MSIQKMDEAIAASSLGQGDRKWWPFWIREFAKSTGTGVRDPDHVQKRTQDMHCQS